MQLRDYHPFAPGEKANPYPSYAQLREQAPVLAVAPPALHVVSRYEDAAFVLKNPALFSSAGMRVSQRMAEHANKLDDELRRASASRSILSSDPPLHTRLRGLVSRAFTPRRVADLEPRIRELTRALLAPLLRKEEIDFMGELATPLPVTVIAELLGVEPERREDFKRWSDHIVGFSATLMAGGDVAPISRSYRELREYMEGFIALRREKPGEDLISALVQGGERESLSPDEVVGFCRLLLIAGNETTTNLLGNCVRALLKHPEELARLRADPALVPNAIEETLRYDSPVQGLMRAALAPATLAGVTIPEGATVLALVGSANRDPRRFPDPERFDITRDTQGHLAFGQGIHFCLGAPLARLEAKVVLEELLAATSGFSFAPGQADSVEVLASHLLRGPKALRVRLEAR